MQVKITGRQLSLKEEFKDYVNEKLIKLSRYSNNIQEAHAVFSRQRFSYLTEIILIGKRFRIKAREKENLLEPSFDKAVSNIERQLKKLRERFKEHRGTNSAAEDLRGLSQKKDIGRDRRRIIKTETAEVKPMSAQEASMELDLFDKDFIVFRNSDDERFNIIYRRKDGNHGLIEL